MKIFKDNKVYVQKNDIAYLNHTDIAIPASIFTKVFGGGIVIIDDRNRYDFIEFDLPEEVKFFEELDWIVNYDDVKDLEDNEIINLGQNLANEKNTMAKRFNSMSNKEKEANMDLVIKCELMDFKIYSLRDILWFKQGHIKMTLPGEESQNGKGIKNKIKSIFRKNK